MMKNSYLRQSMEAHILFTSDKMRKRSYSGLSLIQIQNQHAYKNKWRKFQAIAEEKDYIKHLSPKALLEYINEREQEVFLEKI